MSPTTFGQYLRELRLQRGVSQARLAAMLGVGPTYVCHVERGRKKAVGRGMLGRIRSALRLTDDEVATLQQLREEASGRYSLPSLPRDTASLVRLVAMTHPGLSLRDRRLVRTVLELVARDSQEVDEMKVTGTG